MISMSFLIKTIEELIPEQYAEGMTTAQLRKQWGLSAWKITSLVKKAGVYEERKGGAPLQDYCKEGHEQAVHRKFNSNGYPYCGECKRIRQRVR